MTSINAISFYGIQNSSLPLNKILLVYITSVLNIPTLKFKDDFVRFGSSSFLNYLYTLKSLLLAIS